MVQIGEMVLTSFHAGAGWTLGTSSCTTQQLLMRPTQDGGGSSNIMSVPDLTSMLFGHLLPYLAPEMMSEPLVRVRWRACCPWVLPSAFSFPPVPVCTLSAV